MLPHSTPDASAGQLPSYLYKMHRFATSTNPTETNDFNINNDTHGTSYNISDKYQIGGPNYTSLYTASWGYVLNDIVRIDQQIITAIGTASFTSPVGTYICVKNIPWLDYGTFLTLPSYLQAVISTGSIVDPLVCYAPYSGSNYWQQLGGGGGTFNYGLYSYSSSYAINDLVYVSQSMSGSTKYTSESVTKWVYDGTYVCIQAVQPFVSRPSGSFQMPYYPYEDTGSFTYWHLIAFTPRDFTVCSLEDNSKTYYIHGTEKEPTVSQSVTVL